jgi:prepilin signal peptidase PulO-like enzyme (type II secretory pathway)
MPLLIVFFAALLGLLAGSAVNWLADILPHQRGIHRPAYPDGSPRPILAWSGLLAYLASKHINKQEQRISLRYPLVEVITIALMTVVLATHGDADGRSIGSTMTLLLYVPVFMLIATIDVEHRLILFNVVVPAGLLAFVMAVLNVGAPVPDWQSSLIGGVLGYFLFWLMYQGGRLFTFVLGRMRGETISAVAFGYGDVMLATVSGLMLGLGPFLIALFITVFLGAFGAIVVIMVNAIGSGRYTALTAIPYGPYILAGTFLMLVFQDEIRVLLVGY